MCAVMTAHMRSSLKSIVTGENIVSDGSFIPANASSGSKIAVKQTVLKSTVYYMDEPDEEMSQQRGYRKAEPTEKEVMVLKSRTDPECGYIHQERKKRDWDIWRR